MTFLERDLQRIVVEKLQNEEFRNSIHGKRGVKKIANLNDEGTLPHFSIDNMVRASVAKAAVRVLDSLFAPSLLVEDRNISISTGELLRPDIICIDEGTETLILFELKKSDQTGRQALTELLAYEQEIKNILPFLADYDTALVLISTEWSTLMDHAAASAVTWSGKNLLCLDASVSPDGCEFRVRIPNAWYVTGSTHLPQDSLSCVTICLYDHPLDGEGSYPGDFIIDQRIQAALEMIAREGDRIGSHGFAILWKDFGIGSMAPLNITVCGVSPFAFYRAMREREIIPSDAGGMIPKLDEIISNESLSGHSKALMSLASSVKPMLSDISKPMIEGLTDWSQQEVDMKTRAFPIACDFWGLAGQFVRDYWIHPAVRKHKAHWVRPEVRDWHDPSVALPILASLFVPSSFPDGNVRCSDAFQLGMAVGLDIHLRRALKRSTEQMQPALRCRILWGYFELKNILEEVHLTAQGAVNVGHPETPFELHADPDFDTEESWQSFIEWIVNEFLRAEPIYTCSFQIGLNGALLFDEAMRDRLGQAVRKEFADFIAADVRWVTEQILIAAGDEFLAGRLRGGSLALARKLFQLVGLAIQSATVGDIHAASIELNGSTFPDFVPNILILGSFLIPPVFHSHAPVAAKVVDWEWLRQGISEMRGRGERYPAVQLLASGELVTGPLGMPELASMTPIDAPNDVLFCDQSNGLCVIIKTTWDALKAGEHFPVKESGE